MTVTTQTTCAYCGVGCGLIMEKHADTWRSTPDPNHPANQGRICLKGATLGQTLDMEGRILQASFQGQALSTDQATTVIAERFQDIIAKHGEQAIAFYVSGQMLTEDYYVANKFVKGLLGTANIDTNSRLCMASTVAGQKRAFGADTVPGSYEDLDSCELAIIVGSNMADCHPVLFQRLTQRAIPAKLIVIDPRQTATSATADLHLALAPGSDVALFNGLLNYISSNQACDFEALEHHLSGFSKALKTARRYSISEIARLCDLKESAVLEFYRSFIDHPKTVTLFSQGVNQSSQGTDKVNSIINCHLLSGKIGKVGACPFSLTGQYNAMGGREVGGLANQLAAHMNLEDSKHQTLVQNFWQSPKIATESGLKAIDLFAAMAAGDIKAVWIIATNPLVSLPNRQEIEKALTNCEFVIISECFERNESLAYADMILPAKTWGEKDGTVTNSERRISRQRSFLSTIDSLQADWQWITQVAQKMGYHKLFPYQRPVDIFREHAALSGHQNNGSRSFDISAFSQLSDADYDQLQPIQWPVNERYPQGRARLFENGDYWTKDGKGHLIAVDYQKPSHQFSKHDYPLILLTGRIKEQWHTMTRTARVKQLNQGETAPFCEIHPLDLEIWMTNQQIKDRPSFIRISSCQGTIIAKLRIDEKIKRGCLFIPFHWGKAFGENLAINELTTSIVDPLSGQPELKWTATKLEAFQMAYHGVLLTRQPLTHLPSAWWCHSPGKTFHSYSFADETFIIDYWLWMEDFLKQKIDPREWAYVMDSNRLFFRAYRLKDHQVDTIIWLAAAEESPDFPSIDQLTKSHLKLTKPMRQALLSGTMN